MTDTNFFRFIQWDITSRCNLRCIHCRSESFYGDQGLARDMPLAEVKHTLDNLYVKGIRRIHFLGGEPLCREDIAEIVGHATKIGILCSINTNGTLITKDRARQIIDAGTYLLTFSIDGHDAQVHDSIRGKGSFARLIRGVSNVLAAKQSSNARTRLICSHVLMRQNHRTVERMVDLCTDLGLQNLIITGLRRMGSAEHAYERLAITDDETLDAAERIVQRMKRSHHCNVQIETLTLLGKVYLNAKCDARLPLGRGGCDAITSKAYVQPDGTLFPCQDVAKEMVTHKDRESILNKGLSMWESEPYSGLAAAVESLGVYKDYVPCKACPALGVACTPCPLAGLRGHKFVQESCLGIMVRAKREGIDLSRGLKDGATSAGVERLVASPSFRKEFFGKPPDTWIQEGVGHDNPGTLRTLEAFRDTTLRSLQEVLQQGSDLSCEVGHNVMESGASQ